MDEVIRPYTYVALRLPSDSIKVIEITPNTTISLGKYGIFQANDLLARPYHLTFEILDRPPENARSGLRVVPAAELHEHVASEEHSQRGSTPQTGPDSVEYEVVNPEGKVVMRTNQNIIDDSSSQTLSSEDIETLKRQETASGKDLIAKILASHVALDQKTTFGLAKYTLRKTKKFWKRFTVFPLDVNMLANYFLQEKDAPRIMEIREEILALMCSWSNVHCAVPLPLAASPPTESSNSLSDQRDLSNWLVVDETGGLIVAALAERMGILYPLDGSESEDRTPEHEKQHLPNGDSSPADPSTQAVPSSTQPNQKATKAAAAIEELAMSATSNSITVLHPNSEPNLSLLSYFSFNRTSPDPTHPLYTNLKTISWLQLLSPTDSVAYIEPAPLPSSSLASFKAGKRGAYYRKRRRWARTAAVVDSTRAGGFAGLVVASAMEPASVLHHTVPLLRGGAQVVVYSAALEPLEELADMYSKARRTAFVAKLAELRKRRAKERKEGGDEGDDGEGEVGKEGKEGEEDDTIDDAINNSNNNNSIQANSSSTPNPPSSQPTSPSTPLVPSAEFPLDPSLLLATTVYTARAKPWQVLPGRTHPLMTGRGGSEGYVFVGTRVLPVTGKVEARGAGLRRKKKLNSRSSRRREKGVGVDSSGDEMEMGSMGSTGSMGGSMSEESG